MELVDTATGEVRRVYLFVAVLPFSRLAFVEPCLDMRQDSWLRCHVAMFEAFGGSVAQIVCDNLKTGVIKHPREGEIVLNDAYREMATHYCAAVLPGRVRAPKDKASVENTVGHVATVVIAALREEIFTSLAQLRRAIRERVDAYNQAGFQKRPGCRQSVFESEEAPLLHPLPAARYEISTWVKRRRVARNGHVVWVKNYYSVPYRLVGDHVDLRITDTTVEAWHGQARVASHLLLPATAVNQYSTREADIPQGKAWQPWDPERVKAWADRVGPHTSEVITRIFESCVIADQAINPALAVLRLAHTYSAARLETAAQIALSSTVRSPRYAHIHPVLATSADKQPHRQARPEQSGGGFVHGGSYYGGGTQ